MKLCIMRIEDEKGTFFYPQALVKLYSDWRNITIGKKKLFLGGDRQQCNSEDAARKICLEYENQENQPARKPIVSFIDVA